VTRNLVLLCRLPPDVATTTVPVLAPAGIVAVKKVSDTTLNADAVPANETPDVPVNPCPSNWSVFPTLPAAGRNLTNGPRPCPG
jgi:hypothetical protein